MFDCNEKWTGDIRERKALSLSYVRSFFVLATLLG